MPRKGRGKRPPAPARTPAKVLDWHPYDPSWLVALAAREAPHLVPALRECMQFARESDAYIHFVDPAAPNQPGSEWQFTINEILESPTEGELVLDVLMDGRIGGIEFISRLY